MASAPSKRGIAEIGARPPRRSLRAWVRETGGVARPLVAAALALGLALILTDFAPTPDVEIAAGEIADRDVRASREFQVEDRDLTADARRRAEEQVLSVFGHDVLLAQETEQRLRSAMTNARDGLPEPSVTPAAQGAKGAKRPAGQAMSQEDRAVLDAFAAVLGVQLPEEAQRALLAERFSPQVEEVAASLLQTAMRGYVILSKDVLPGEGRITVRRVEGGEETEVVLKDLAKIRDREEAREALALAHLDRLGDRAAAPGEQAARVLAQALVVPNLSYDASATVARREEARLRVQPIFKEYQRGEVIVRVGEVVKPWQMDAIATMLAGRSSYRPGLHLLSLTCLLGLVVAVLYTFSTRFIRKFSRTTRDIAALSILMLMAAGMTRLAVAVAEALADRFPGIPETAYWYAVPVAATAMLVRILMNSETAIVFTAFACLVCGYLMGHDLLMTIYLLVGSLAAAGGLAHANERGKLFRAGILTALVNAATAIAIAMVEFSGIGFNPGQVSAVEPLLNVAFGVAGGLFSGVIVLGLVPVFEGMGYLTDIKLLELSSLNHPLLREMIVRAPGTYHHSMVVGQLSEAAAETVGARALLARVGCYFHDIGKMVKPQYFVENQHDCENLHDRLSPSMSALIITNHVKDGIELGRRHGLPQALIDLIPQHHGTAVVSFFYNKAKQMEDPAIARVDDADFRYPGPKPQTREAGIIMLADGVEAATRSLRQPTPGAIKARVARIIEKVIADGQLDECPLTMRELKVISDTFNSVLIGIHHHRIEYPEFQAPEKKKGLPLSAVALEGDPAGLAPAAALRPPPRRPPPPVTVVTTTGGGGDPDGGRDTRTDGESPLSADFPAISSGEIAAGDPNLVVLRTTAGIASGRKKV